MARRCIHCRCDVARAHESRSLESAVPLTMNQYADAEALPERAENVPGQRILDLLE